MVNECGDAEAVTDVTTIAMADNGVFGSRWGMYQPYGPARPWRCEYPQPKTSMQVVELVVGK